MASDSPFQLELREVGVLGWSAAEKAKAGETGAGLPGGLKVKGVGGPVTAAGPKARGTAHRKAALSGTQN